METLPGSSSQLYENIKNSAALTDNDEEQEENPYEQISESGEKSHYQELQNGDGHSNTDVYVNYWQPGRR